MNSLPADRNRRVLVIDDNRAIHDDFRKILLPGSSTAAALDATESAVFGPATDAVQQARFEVDSAYQGQEGVLMVKKAFEEGRPYAMAFVDVRMPPGWDGVETTQKLWELDPDLQVVLCTAYSDYSWEEMFEKLGQRDGLLILKKPFDTVEAFQLARALTEKWWLHQQSQRKMEELESRVAERTRELQRTNQELQTEVVEHTRAERTLGESEEKFRQLAANVTDVFYMTSPDMQQMHYVSPAYEQIWGHSTESLYANPNQWAEAILPEERERVFATFSRLAADERSVSEEFRIMRPDGTARWILSRGFQVRDAAGKVIRITGIASDITERKKAEETLRLLSTAVEQSKESILITDAQLDLPGPRILFVNSAFTRMTGYTAEEAIGKTPRMLQGPRTDKAVLRQLRQNLERGEVFDGEAINVRKDGTEFTLEWQVAPIRSPGGAVTHFVAIQRDITERRRIEGQLIQSQKFETVGKLAGGIAHEFNSIMTAIIGQSELLLGELPSGNPLSHHASEIRKAADRAATLTRQLLAYGRKQILQPEILDLNKVLAGMDSMLHNLMGGVVDVRIAPAAGLKAVKADAGQIEQVIMNMAINAHDAMPHGGKLTLETSNVTLDTESVGRYADLKPGEYVMLAITDTGAGINEQVKARMFEPFFTTKGVGLGTGLGLATCFGIVKQSGGHITVYSEPGRGSTFKIYLPQVEREVQGPPARGELPALLHGTETILLVEDDPSLREMASMLLERLGYTVLAAANGDQALSLVKQRGKQTLDLLFTDVVMPRMDGRELSDRIRATHPDTKVLFTSAYTENAIVHQGVLDTGVALLQKPFTPTALAHRLREVLDAQAPPRQLERVS